MNQLKNEPIIVNTELRELPAILRHARLLLSVVIAMQIIGGVAVFLAYYTYGSPSYCAQSFYIPPSTVETNDQRLHDSYIKWLDKKNNLQNVINNKSAETNAVRNAYHTYYAAASNFYGLLEPKYCLPLNGFMHEVLIPILGLYLACVTFSYYSGLRQACKDQRPYGESALKFYRRWDSSIITVSIIYIIASWGVAFKIAYNNWVDSPPLHAGLTADYAAFERDPHAAAKDVLNARWLFKRDHSKWQNGRTSNEIVRSSMTGTKEWVEFHIRPQVYNSVYSFVNFAVTIGPLLFFSVLALLFCLHDSNTLHEKLRSEDFQISMISLSEENRSNAWYSLKSIFAEYRHSLDYGISFMSIVALASASMIAMPGEVFLPPTWRRTTFALMLYVFAAGIVVVQLLRYWNIH